MMRPAPMRPAEVDAARVIVAGATASACGHDVRDAILAYLPDPSVHDTGTSGALTVDGAVLLTAADVAMAAASLIGKMIGDVETVMRVDRTATLARAGAWVQAQEAG